MNYSLMFGLSRNLEMNKFLTGNMAYKLSVKCGASYIV